MANGWYSEASSLPEQAGGVADWVSETAAADVANLNANLTSGQRLDPEKVRRITRASYRSHLPVDVVAGNLDAIEGEIARPNFDAQRFQNESPIVAKWIADHPYYAGYTQKELKAMGAIERLVNTPRALWPKPRAVIQQEAWEMAKAASVRSLEESEEAKALSFPLLPEITFETPEQEQQAREAAAYKQALAVLQAEEDFLAGTGPAGAIETLQKRYRENPLFMVPVLSGLVGTDNALQLVLADKAAEEGNASKEQLSLLVRVGRMEAAAQRRGTSFAAQVASTTAEMIPFGLEFYALGPFALGKEVAEAGAAKVVAKTAAKSLLNRAVRRASQFAGYTALQAVVTGRATEAGFQDMRLQGNLSETEDAITYTVRPGSGRSVPLALARGLVTAWSEVASEYVGEIPIIAGMNKALGKAIFGRWLKANPGGTAEAFWKFMGASGWHGTLVEMGEEEVGKAIRATFGIEEYRLPTLTELGTEAVAFSIPGLIGGSLALGSRRKQASVLSAHQNVAMIESALDSLKEVEGSISAPEAVAAVLDKALPGQTQYINSDELVEYAQTVGTDPRTLVGQLTGDEGALDAVPEGGEVAVPTGKYLMALNADPSLKGLNNLVHRDEGGVSLKAIKDLFDAEGETPTLPKEDVARMKLADEQAKEIAAKFVTSAAAAVDAGRASATEVRKASEVVAASYKALAEIAGVLPKELEAEIPVPAFRVELLGPGATALDIAIEEIRRSTTQKGVRLSDKAAILRDALDFLGVDPTKVDNKTITRILAEERQRLVESQMGVPEKKEEKPGKRPTGLADSFWKSVLKKIREGGNIVARPREPQTAVRFLISRGGVKDTGGELKALQLYAKPKKGEAGYGQRSVSKFRGLINNKRGMTLDEARLALQQEGFLEPEPENAPPRTSVRDIFDIIESEVRYDDVLFRIDEGAEFVTQVTEAENEERGIRMFVEAAGVVADTDTDVQALAKLRAFEQKVIAETPEGQVPQFFQETLGAFGWHPVAGPFIRLFAKSDLTTIMHEYGHFMLEALRRLSIQATASDRMKQMAADVGAWLAKRDHAAALAGLPDAAKAYAEKNGGIDFMRRVAETMGSEVEDPNLRAELLRFYSEAFADSFESYLKQGEAPSTGLRRAFEFFARVITKLYKVFRRTAAPLDAEVAKLFDRLLATQEEIDAMAEDVRIQSPLGPDIRAIGGTEEEQAAVDRMTSEAQDAVYEAFRKDTMEAIRKRDSVDYKAKKAKIIREVTAEVRDLPSYRAVQSLRTGQTADGQQMPRASRESILRIRGERGLAGLPVGIAADRGLTADVNDVAVALGYTSGREMLDKLEDLPPTQVTIQREVERRMEEAFPDEAEEQSIEERVDRAYHAVPADRLRLLELKWMARQELPALMKVLKRVAPGRRVPRADDIRREAKHRISRMAVRDIVPRRFESSEKRWAREAIRAFAAGDLDAAFTATIRRWVAWEMASESYKALDNISSAVKEYRRLASADSEAIAKSRDVAAVNAALHVAGAWKMISAESYHKADTYIEQVMAYAPGDIGPQLELDIERIEQSAHDYREASYAEVEEIIGFADALLERSLEDRKIELGQKAEDIQEVRNEIIQRAGVLREGKPARDYRDQSKFWEKTKGFVLGAKAFLRRMEHWSDAYEGGNEKGAMVRLFRQVSKAADECRDLEAKFQRRFLSIVKTVEHRLTKDAIPAPELGLSEAGNPHVFQGLGELYTAILHTGTFSNFRKLLCGYEWGRENDDGTLETGNWDRFIERAWREKIITAEDMAAIQAIWDLLDEMKPLAQRAHKKIYGAYFREIDPVSVRGPWGELRGGYFPAKTDFSKLKEKMKPEELEKIQRGERYGAMRPSSTFARNEQYTAPLLLDIGIVTRHIKDIVRYATVQPVVRDVARVLNGDRILRETLAAVDPTALPEMIVPWLNRSASQEVEANVLKGRLSFIENAVRAVRRTVVGTIMFTNVKNALEQATGLSVALTKVEALHMKNALAQYFNPAVGPRALAEAAAEMSLFMKNRLLNQLIEARKNLYDLTINPSMFTKSVRWFQDHEYWMQAAVQNQVDIVTWTAAYNEAVAKGESQDAAVEHADSVVRMTQGSWQAEDVSRFETGTPLWRVWVTFFGYFNMLGNLQATEVAKSARTMAPMAAGLRMFYIYAATVAVPSAVTTALVAALRGLPPDEDDDGALDELVWAWNVNQIRTLGAEVPFAGEVASKLADRWIGAGQTWRDDRLFDNPTINRLDSALLGGAEAARRAVSSELEISGSDIKNVIDLVSIFTGVPLGAVGRQASFLWEARRGNVDPDGFMDWSRGILTGARPKE